MRISKQIDRFFRKTLKNSKEEREKMNKKIIKMTRNFKEPVVRFFGGVSAESVDALIGEIEGKRKECPGKEITLFINSTGGSAAAGLAFYDYVTNLLAEPLTTVILGEASSIGVIVFLSGKKRFVGKNALMELHEVGFRSEDYMTTSRTKAAGREFEIVTENYTKIIEQRTSGKISAQEAEKMMKENTILSSREMVELGLAHEIL